MQVQRPVLSQEQKLRMNPQLYQSIKLMALPLTDLKFRIQQEVEENPALEILEEGPTLSYDESLRRRSEEYEYFENSSDPGYSSSYNEEASESKRKFMEGALSRPESLHDHILWQLRLQPISPRQFALGEMLIMNLDENGFHREDPKLLVKKEEEKDLFEICELIQSFEPIGCCTGDYRESLLVQTRLLPEAPPYTEEIIADYFELLEKGKYSVITKRMKISEEDVRNCLNFIKSLEPLPGRNYSTERPRYVIPDLEVRIKDGQFVIIMNDEEIPVLGLNPMFEDIIENGKEKGKRELRKYVNEKVKNARWFIHSIQQRNQTLLKVSKAIVEFQRDFFMRGPKYLVPLTLKDIANEVGVHEATVSRITTEKYMETDWGIFELKYFFSNSISGAGSTGSRFSKEGVKQIIKEILEAEGGEKHLSDKKISELLAQRGINIARRTVAKYRKELDIDSSYGR